MENERGSPYCGGICGSVRCFGCVKGTIEQVSAKCGCTVGQCLPAPLFIHFLNQSVNQSNNPQQSKQFNHNTVITLKTLLKMNGWIV